MKRKILSYLLGWFLAVLLGFWVCITHTDATWGNGNSSEEEVFWGWAWEEVRGDQNWGGEEDGNNSNWGASKEWWNSKCDWIKLNTNFPLIWDCISTKKDWNTNPTNAFPTMMWALTKIVMSLILVVCFICIIVGWIMRAADKPKEWKALIIKVAITILLLWFSGVILKLVNPNFFS